MVTQLGEKEGFVLKTSYNNTRGFFIQITSDNKLRNDLYIMNDVM